MSLLQFIASDEPLEEVENHYIKWMSINQAIKNGIKIENWLLDNPNIDKDNERLVMFCDSREHLGELEILKLDKDLAKYSEEYSCKRYFSKINWEYIDEREEQFIEYVHNHLKHSSEVEVWRIWMDEHLSPKKYRLKETEITPKQIKKFFKQDGFYVPECMIIEKEG